MMFHVALIAVALQLAIASPGYVDHWRECTAVAEEERGDAAVFDILAASVAADEIVAPDLVIPDKTWRLLPFTGGYARKLARYHDARARYHEARARLYEGHRWRFWTDKPPELPPPPDR